MGKREYIERIQRNPITRAVRIDKLTLAGFEATLMEYIDEEKVTERIPTLRMLLQKPEEIKARANKIASRLKREIRDARIQVIADNSRAGGGALPEMDLPTYAVSINPERISVNELEERMRKGTPPIITRIKDEALILDARTIREKDFDILIQGLKAALSDTSA